MKNLNYILFILIGTTLYCCKSRKDADNSKGKLPDLKSASVAKNDTVKTYTYDTLAKATYDLRVVADYQTKELFRPYFVNDICEPGDMTNPIYTKFIERGKRESEKALLTLKNSQTVRENLFDKISKNIDFSSVKLTQIPVYHLTPNVVLYTNGQNIKQYYNLDSDYITYMVFHENKAVGRINYKADRVSMQPYYEADSLSYHNVLSLKKIPSILYNAIKGMRGPVQRVSFGYVQSDHIVFAICSQGGYYNTTNGIRSPEFQLQKCNTQIAEAYFSQPGSGPSILTRLIKDVYEGTLKN